MHAYQWLTLETKSGKAAAFDFLNAIRRNLKDKHAVLFVYGIGAGSHMVVLRKEGQLLVLYDPQRGSLSSRAYIPPFAEVKPNYHKVSTIGRFSNFTSLILEICFMSGAFGYVPGATVADIMNEYFRPGSTGVFMIPVEVKHGGGRKRTFRRKRKVHKNVRHVQTKKGKRRRV
jgi:hypothetical protein